MIGVSVNGLNQLTSGLHGMYPKAAAKGVENANKILLAALNRYVASAPYNYLSWSMGGPGDVGGFFSERQRAFVMASISQGSMTIPYPRVKKDHYALSGTGAHQSIKSDDVSMYYSMSDMGQTIMQALRGWDRISVFLQGHNADILQAFTFGVNGVISEMMSSTAP